MDLSARLHLYIHFLSRCLTFLRWFWQYCLKKPHFLHFSLLPSYSGLLLSGNEVSGVTSTHWFCQRLLSYTLSHFSLTYSARILNFSKGFRCLKWKARKILWLFQLYVFSLFPFKEKQSCCWLNRKNWKIK